MMKLLTCQNRAHRCRHLPSHTIIASITSAYCTNIKPSWQPPVYYSVAVHLFVQFKLRRGDELFNQLVVTTVKFNCGSHDLPFDFG